MQETIGIGVEISAACVILPPHLANYLQQSRERGLCQLLGMGTTMVPVDLEEAQVVRSTSKDVSNSTAQCKKKDLPLCSSRSHLPRVVVDAPCLAQLRQIGMIAHCYVSY